MSTANGEVVCHCIESGRTALMASELSEHPRNATNVDQRGRNNAITMISKGNAMYRLYLFGAKSLFNCVSARSWIRLPGDSALKIVPTVGRV